VWSLQYFVSELFVPMFCMPGLGQGLPWRDMIGTGSCRFNSAKREALNSVLACQVWARGHNQKKISMPCKKLENKKVEFHYQMALPTDAIITFIRLRQNTLQLAAGMNGGANAPKLEQRPSSSDAIGYGRRCPQ